MTTVAGTAEPAGPAEVRTAPAVRESLASRVAARTGEGVLRVFLVLVALFWLMPTVGLLISSFRGPADIAGSGWWKVLTAPSQLTVANYEELLGNGTVTSSLATRC